MSTRWCITKPVVRWVRACLVAAEYRHLCVESQERSKRNEDVHEGQVYGHVHRNEPWYTVEDSEGYRGRCLGSQT
ncbi:hypothetical protein J6590_067063 [Homalodisca vitripennis]|nr:hypothetical protein J6590_067063 [Homalodisca vitripennis]